MTTSSFKAFDAELMTQYDAQASEALGADHWRVCEAFRYYIGEEFSDQWVYVPAGYLTDGASVPRIFWNIIPPWGKYGQAAVVHDILCEYLSITVDGTPTRITRERADKILLEAMQVLGVPWITRWAIYSAVSTYRVLFRVDEPSTTTQKRLLETKWRMDAAA